MLNDSNGNYWAVELQDGAKVLLLAEAMHVINGDLTFFDNDGNQLTAFAKGSWKFTTAAHVLDGTYPLIEHWFKGSIRTVTPRIR